MLRPGPRPPCPDCDADDVLALRLIFRHHPPLLLRWLAPLFPIHLTLVYTCTACHHLVRINTIHPRSRALLPSAAQRARSPATTPPRPPACDTYTRTSVL